MSERVIVLPVRKAIALAVFTVALLLAVAGLALADLDDIGDGAFGAFHEHFACWTTSGGNWSLTAAHGGTGVEPPAGVCAGQKTIRVFISHRAAAHE